MATKTQSWYEMKAAANHGQLDVYIYDSIGYWGITAKDFAEDLMGHENVDHINVFLHSPGGEVFDGVSIYNSLKSHAAKVHVQIDGYAASMATIIALAGDTVSMSENAFFMIHQPSIWGLTKEDLTGFAEDLKNDAQLLDKIERKMLNIYHEATGLDLEEIWDMLAAETWMTAEEALDKGFITAITEPTKAAASLEPLNRMGIDKVPDRFKAIFGETEPDQGPPKLHVMIQNAIVDSGISMIDLERVTLIPEAQLSSITSGSVIPTEETLQALAAEIPGLSLSMLKAALPEPSQEDLAVNLTQMLDEKIQALQETITALEQRLQSNQEQIQQLQGSVAHLAKQPGANPTNVSSKDKLTHDDGSSVGTLPPDAIRNVRQKLSKK